MAISDAGGGLPYQLEAGFGIPGFGSDVKAGVASTRGRFTLIESRTRGGAPLHVHSREDEFMYVLEGTLSVQLGDESFEAGPRSFVSMPRDLPHAWDVISDEAVVLIMTVPAMLEEFLVEYHEAMSRSPEERDAVAAKYGITFLPCRDCR